MQKKRGENMFCSNCGAKAEGNFCNNCGAPLPKQEPDTGKNNESIDAEYKVYDEEEDPKKKDKQKNVKVTIKNKRGGFSRNTTTTKRKRRSVLSSGGDAVSSAASTAGNAVGKSVKTAGNVLFTGLHWLCALLMIRIALQIFKNVWNYTSISTIMGLASTRDINTMVFIGVSAFLVLFGIIEALWILGSKKVMDMGVLRNIDTGRGIFAFGLFVVLTILAPFIDGLLSFGYSGLEGGKWVLHAFTKGNGIFYFAVFGLILSFVRKMRGSIRGMIA